MFESLSDKLDLAFKGLSGNNKLTEINIAQSIKEIRRALVSADVNYKIAKEFTDKVKDEALGSRNVLKAVKPGELMVKIVMDEMIRLMGGQSVGINVKGKPGVVLIAGLQGSGKTTFTGKLSKYLKEKKNMKVLVAACDVYRPAAVNQLGVIAEQVGVDIYKEVGNTNPIEIAGNAVVHAQQNNYNVLGDTRGGAALSVKYTVGKPIKFVSTGEKMEDLDVFHPDRMAQRILGMGDIVSFVEKAQDQYDEVEAKRLEKKIKKNKFDFNDFLGQLNQIRKMGDLKSLMGMIPGMSKLKDLDIDDNAFSKVESIILSMTQRERTNPEILNMSRKKRIAKGCGRNIHEINMFIKQFDQMRKMMHMMSKGKGMNQMMQNFGNMPGMKGFK